MNILLNPKKENGFTKKKSTIKTIITFRRQLKTTGQQQQQSLPQPQRNSIEKSRFLLQEKPKDFTTIFAKQKRSEYSGYKQIYLNQTTIIKTNNDQRSINKNDNSRRYEIKLKNIAKLRKRYSTQPTNIKQYQTKSQSHFGKVNLLTNQNQPINSYRQIKEVVTLQTKKHMSSQRVIQNKQPPAQLSERARQTKISRIMKIHQQIMLPKLSQIQCMPQDIISIQKPNFTQIRKGGKTKIRLGQKNKQITLQNQLLTQNGEDQLHGWSAQSFYPKKVLPFFKDLPQN